MTKPTYTLPVTGVDPDKTATREAHEAAIQAAIDAIWTKAESIEQTVGDTVTGLQDALDDKADTALVVAAARAGLLSLANASGVNAITAEMPSALSAVTLTTGTAALLNPTGANTGDVTLDVGDGATPVLGGDLEQLPAGTLRQNRPVLLRYSTVSGGRWVLASSGMTRAEVFAALAGKATTAQGALADSAVQPGDDIDTLSETSSAKIMTDAERTKLGGIAEGATANDTDAALRDRSTHTGTQPPESVEGLLDALEAKLDADAAAMSASRPGEAPGAWGGSLVGASIDPLPGILIAADPQLARCIEIEDQPAIVALRDAVHVEPGRIYAARCVVRRTSAPADPAGDVVQFGVQWLNETYQSVGHTVLQNINFGTSTGIERTETRTLAMTWAPRDYTMPLGARLARPYVRVFGSDSTTRIGTVQFTDISDFEGFAGVAAQSAADALASANAAGAQASVAGVHANNASASAASASDSDASAQASAIVAGAPIFSDTATGLAGTSSGGFFYVPEFGGLRAYENDDGTAVPGPFVGQPVFALLSTFQAAIAAGYDPVPGTVIHAGGYSYLRVAGATGIAALPGWRVFGDTAAPEQFGAQSGVLLDPIAREIVDDLIDNSNAVSVQYAYLLHYTVLRFIRAGVWDGVTWANDAGIITFAPTGITELTEGGWKTKEQLAFEWIAGRYYQALTGINILSDPVTAADLDAAEAIDPAENDVALAAWVAWISGGRAVGVMQPRTYPISLPVRLRDTVTIRGVPGMTCLRMDSGVMANNEQRLRNVVYTGDIGEPARNIDVFGVIADYNWRRLPSGNIPEAAGPKEDNFTTVPNSTSLRGSAWAIGYTKDSRFSHIWGLDAYKHGIDATGSTHGRSGTPYEYPPRSEMSEDVVFTDTLAEGCGDDAWTSHNCRNIYLTRGKSGFARPLHTPINCNGFEVDDASQKIFLRDIEAYFVFSGLEIKGHSDAIAPDDVFVYGTINAYGCNSAVNMRHPGHGQTVVIDGDDEDEPTSTVVPSPFSENVYIEHIRHVSPVRWAGGTTRRALQIQCYRNVTVGRVDAIQQDADPEYYGPGTSTVQAVVSFFRQPESVYVGSIYIEGFSESSMGLRVTNSCLGHISVGFLQSINGPKNRLVQHTAENCILSIDGYDLRRNEVEPESRGINSNNPQNVIIGPGFISGYEMPTRVAPRLRRQELYTDDDDLFDFRLDGPLNQIVEGWFTVGTGIPDNAPPGVTTGNFIVRQGAPTSLEIEVRDLSGQSGTWRNRYTGGAWQGWEGDEVRISNATGWGGAAGFTFDGDLNDLMTDFPRGIYTTTTSVTNNPSGFGTSLFMVLNMPRANGTRGSQMAFAGPGGGSARVALRGYGTDGFTGWEELSSTIPPGPFADDAAAASGGVPVGAIYRQTGGAVLWRQS